MNILMIVSWFTPEGTPIKAGIFHYELAKAMKKYAGYNVAIYFPYDFESKELSKEITNDEIVIYRSRITRYNRFSVYNSDFNLINKEFKPSVLFAQCALPAGMCALFLSNKYHIPYFVTEHCPPQMMIDRFYMKWFRKLIYKKSISNTTVSGYMKDYLEERNKSIKFELIYNGVELDFIDNEKSCPVLENDCYNACIVAMFYDKDIKGFQYLIPAIKEYNNKHEKKIHLHICGGGQYEEYYKDMVADLILEEYVTFYGSLPKSEVFSIINKMDFCISASIFESAGVFVEEAQLLGKPLVVTESGGASSLVNEKSAFVVENKSTKALVSGIDKMIKNLHSFSSEQIRQDAEKRFLMKNVCQCYKEIFKKIEL